MASLCGRRLEIHTAIAAIEIKVAPAKGRHYVGDPRSYSREAVPLRLSPWSWMFAGIGSDESSQVSLTLR